MDLPNDCHNTQSPFNIVTALIPDGALVDGGKSYKFVLYYRGHKVQMRVNALGDGVEMKLKFMSIVGAKYPESFGIGASFNKKWTGIIVNGTHFGEKQYTICARAGIRPFRYNRDIIIRLFMNLGDDFIAS